MDAILTKLKTAKTVLDDSTSKITRAKLSAFTGSLIDELQSDELFSNVIKTKSLVTTGDIDSAVASTKSFTDLSNKNQNKAEKDLSNVTPTDLDHSIRLTQAYKTLAEKQGLPIASMPKLKVIESMDPVVFTNIPNTFLELVYQFKSDNQVITQTLPAVSENRTIIITLATTTFNGCSLVLQPNLADQIDGVNNPLTLTNNGVAGILFPENADNYEWLPYPVLHDYGVVVSDDKGNIFVGNKNLKFANATATKANDEVLITMDQSTSPAPVATSGIAVSYSSNDQVQTVTDITEIQLESVNVVQDQGNTNKVTATPYITILDAQDATKIEKASGIMIERPLIVRDMPQVMGTKLLSIDKLETHQINSDGYLAYAFDYIELKPSTGSTVPIPDSVWFDDVRVPAGDYITLDRNTKRIAIEERDYNDPNITGGSSYIVSLFVDLEGTAKSYCFIDMYLQGDDGLPIFNWKGDPMRVTKYYNVGDKFGKLEITDIVNAKELKFMKVTFDHNDDDIIAIKPAYKGLSGIMIQSIDKYTKTGLALLQYENDLGKKLRFGTSYVDTLYNMAPLLAKDKPETLVDINKIQSDTDTFATNSTPMYMAIHKQKLVIRDNKISPMFGIGSIIDSYITKLLRGKNIHTEIILTTPLNNMRVSLAVWKGEADKYTDKIFTGMDSNGALIMERDWFIAEDSQIDSSSGRYEDLTTFVVPDDAINFALFITPDATSRQFELQLEQFKIVSDEKFLAHILVNSDNIAEIHYSYMKLFKTFHMNDDKTRGLRYTINKADTKMPVGVEYKGDAPVVLDKVWTDSGFDGEGALKFTKDGPVNIKYSVIVYPGEAIANANTSTVKFWFAKQTGTNTFDKITQSENTINIQGSHRDGAVFEFPSFDFAVKANDVIWLFASAGVDDGAYIQSTKPSQNMVSIDVIFNGLTQI